MLTGDTPTPDHLNGFQIDAPAVGFVKEVTVNVDPELQDVLNDVGGDVPITGGSWVLTSSDSSLTFDWSGVSDAQLQADGLMNDFSVFGGAVTITETTSQSNGDPLPSDGECPSPPSPPTVDVHEFDIFRYLNPVYASQSAFPNLLGPGAVAADQLPFPDAVVAGDNGASSQTQALDLNINPDLAAVPTVVGGLDFSAAGNVITFTPVSTGSLTDTLEFQPNVDLQLVGTGTDEQVVNLNRQSLIDTLNAYTDTSSAAYATVSSSNMLPLIQSEIATNGAASIADAILNQVKAYFPTSTIDMGADTAPSAITVNWSTGSLGGGGGSVVLGNATSGIDNAADISAVVDDSVSLPQAAIDYQLSQAINEGQSGSNPKTVDIYLSSYLSMWSGSGAAEQGPGWGAANTFITPTLANFEFGESQTVAHEVGHDLGLVHTFSGIAGAVDAVDVMAYANNWTSYQPSLSFNTSGSALTLSLDQASTQALVDSALSYYTIYRVNTGVSLAYPAFATTNGTSSVTQSGTGIPPADIDNPLSPPPAQAVLLVTDPGGQPVAVGANFGTATVGNPATRGFDILNYGTDSVQVQNVWVTGDPAFSLVPTGSIQQTLTSGNFETFSVVYNPTLGPSTATLNIQTSISAKPISYTLTGNGTVAGPALVVDNTNDNLGGAQLGNSVTTPNALVLHNYGSSPLHITGLNVIADGAEFKINGASGNLSASPIVIAPGGSYDISVTYSPNQKGLAHGVIQINSDDPNNATLTSGVDGLGADNHTVGAWGNDYIAIQFPDMGDIATIRTISDAHGNFNVHLPPSEPYIISIFDPLTGLIAKQSGITGLPGQNTGITSQLVFKASTARDTDGDGLPDDIEFAIGSNPNKSDTNSDGTSDFVALKNGSNPVAGLSSPEGDNVPAPPPTSPTATDPYGLDPVFNATYPIVVHEDSAVAALSATDKAQLNYAIYVAQTKLEQIVANTPSRPALITGSVDTGLVVNGLRIEFGINTIDGVGGALARTNILQNRGDGMPSLARVTLDQADLPALLAQGNLDTLIGALEHEFLQALGFGGSFGLDGLVDNSNPAAPGFTGANAVAAYDLLSGTSATEVPLDNRSGALPTNWNESVFGNEVGTPLLDQSSQGVFINGQALISAVTIGALKDLGYTVDETKADPYALPGTSFQFDYRATAPTTAPGSVSGPVLFAAPPTTPTAAYFAFGAHGMQPLQGYTRVNPGTQYSPTTGYGFISTFGITASPLVTVNETLTSNDIQTKSATFRVDLADGTYDVFLTLGDNKQAGDTMNYSLNGVQRGVVGTLVGQHVTIMDRVEVLNGRLTVTLSGASPVMLNAIAAVRINTHTTPPGGPSYSSGQYYVALENLSTGTVMRMKVNVQPGGAFCPQGVLLAPNTAYREYAYNVDQNTVGYSDFVTSRTGTFDMPSIVMGQHLTKSTDGSGLEKLAEFIIGLPSNGTGKTASGITYLQALKDGLDPTAGTVLPVGIVGAQTLSGNAQAVTVVGSTDNAAHLTAYVATTSGLSIVDVTQPTKPTILSQLVLPGQASAIAVDPILNEVAIAGTAGLIIVDVSNSVSPTLLTTVAFSDTVNDVTVSDGIAYITEGTSIATVDLATFEVRASLDLSTFGATTLEGIAFDGKTAFAMDAAHHLWSVSVNGDVLTEQGTLSLSAASGKITIGGNVLYVPAFNGFLGGYETVDISNPASMTLISGATGTALEGTKMVLNGTGLGVAIGAAGRVNALDVIDVSDPTNTNVLNNRVTLPQTPLDVSLANGLAFVADGNAGLTVVNYIGTDVKGVAPKITIRSNAIDVDSHKSGTQVVEGTVLTIHPTASDDVQIRNIELMVNGKVVANNVAYPFDFDVLVPSIASSGSTMNVQLVAFDTGGNKKISNTLTFNVVPDTVPPMLVSTSISENASLFFVKSVQVNFNERIDPSKINAAGVALVNAGADGVIGTADDSIVPVSVMARPLGQTLTILLANPLPAGTFKLTVSPSIIFDTHGNELVNPVVLDFTVRPASDVNALSGAPAITQEPSANPGQTIGLAVPFDPTTAHMVFDVIDTNGTTTTRDIATTQVDLPSSKAFFQVPLDAVTGNVVVYGLSGGVRTDFADGTFPLEIVPVLTSITVSSVASDGSSASVQLRGRGFIEANNTTYTFGTTAVLDTSPATGPDVFQTSVPNDTVNLTVPLNAGSFGPIIVTTAGGTSAPLVVSLSGIVGTAMSGTPANAALPSANAGQAVKLTGTGLGMSTGVMMTYTGSDGVVRTVLLNPTSAAADGSSATLIVPTYANGITTINVLGSSTPQTLQVVPTLTSYSVDSTNTLRLFGTGLQEGSGATAVSYNFAGGTVSDTSAATGPDVYNSIGGSDNNSVYLPSEPVHGFGSITTTTPGGTSAPLTLNEFETGVGLIRAIAFDPANPTHLWVGNSFGPAQISLIDVTTGQPVAASPSQVSAIPITNVSGATNDIGDTSFLGSMQIVPQSMALGFTPVPKNSLLVFYGSSNPDYVVALDPTTGNVMASLQLSGNYDATAGIYDPTTNELFVVNRNSGGSNFIVGISPVTGAEDPAHTFAAPFNLGDGGLALDPSGDGTFWLASDQSGDIVHITNTGTILQHLTIGLQTPGNIGASGIVFDAAGNLLVATNQGVVLQLKVNIDFANTPPTLTAINGTATNGTPANAALPSADAGQVITLTGTNFNAGTEVVFPIRDASGNTGLLAVTPLAINPAGTTLQVQVPSLATTGAIQVVNVSRQNLGFGTNNDAIYRGVTVQFTAGSSSSSINFADGGTEGIFNESWGIDNVAVTQGGTTVFADNFESGTANADWTQNVVDTSTQGAFTKFLGRFSSGGDTLNLSGLTAGQTYTLKFDLYAIDSLDGEGYILDGSGNIVPAQYGPDELNVTIDGTSKLSLAMSYNTGAVQNFNGSGTLPLQIVPTLTGMDGTPSGDGTFNLFGSGFQAGAMTVTIGGVTLSDSQFTNQYQNHILNGANGQDRIVAPLVLDGPVTVTTAGGSATLPGYAFPVQPPVQFTGIVATASSGIPANGAVASANAGQTITLLGQGFTNSTLVLFPAQDASGTNGQLVRTGSASSDGTTLTLVVPALARTGTVQVMGTAASYQLQIVPVLRSVGGSVQSGNTIEIDASGLPPGEVIVQIDGRGVGTFNVKDTYDVNVFGVTAPPQTQQILTLVVPPSIGAGLITVQTNGGIATLQSGVTLAAQPGFLPSGDAGDTIATATAITLPVNATINVPGTVGDGANGPKDVDLYSVTLAAGEQLSVGWSGNLYSEMRFFNAAGQQVGTQFGPYVAPNQTGTVAQFTAPVSGTYYLGVTGYPNTSYDPTVAGSGTTASYTGNYSLVLERLEVGGTRLSAIAAAAGSGTPANAGIASANIGQTITLDGSGLLAADQIVFTCVDDSGDLFAQTVNPTTVAADGSSLTVVVPAQATTGTVRLARDSTGLLLQVVPTLSHIDMNIGGPFNGGGGTVTGSGFSEGTTTLNFGASHLSDTARDANGLDIYTTNHNLNFTAPNGAATGPFSVTTLGGTSSVYALSFTGITSTLLSGTALVGGQAAANPGQLITLTGSGFDTSADIVFATVDDGGVKGQVVVHPIAASADGSNATVVVPGNAVTGVVRVVGDLNGNGIPLQIVPTIASITVNSVASDGSSASITLHGSGFVDGYNTTWAFGSTPIIDASSVNQGPDVFSVGTAVNLTVPLIAGSFGPISVTTGGGTSAPLAVSLSGITSTAMSGTPANAALPSANSGQAITLTGAGLTTSTSVMMTYTGSDGIVRTILLNPSAAAADRSSATLIIPTYANGVTKLSVLGSSTSQTLQIVPTLTSYAVDGTNTLRLFGTGLQEGSAGNTVSYNFPGGSVSDTTSSVGPDVYNVISGSDNSAVYLPSEPVHGFGTITTTTAGGTSAPLTLNELQAGVGLIRSMAMNTSNPTQAWVADNGSPAALHLIDMTTGQQIRSIAITQVSNATNSPGNATFVGALQVVPTSFTLGSTPVPAGSLLTFYAPTNPDYVVALDPTTGNLIASLQLAANYDATAGVYDPVTGELFLVDRSNSGANRVVAIFTTTGGGHTAGDEDPAHTFAAPFNLSDGALALDPSGDGTLWLGSDQSGNIVHITNTGTILKTVSISPQAPGNIGVSGMVFDASGNLLVSTDQGAVVRLNVNFDAAALTPTPTLTSINATATNGTPANAAVPSADAGQVITLIGTNFTSSTEVVFPIRDASGNTAQLAVAPMVINAAGTSLQVQVPTLATTGAIQVVNTSNLNLGFGTNNDAIYRGMTAQFVATSSTSAINFADGGTEGIGNESWGLDNVSVSQGASTIFSDNFESGAANAAWTQNVVDTSTQGVFTKFLGRFSNASENLNLTGLTPGQTYTLHFDLYALDSLDGEGYILDGSGNIVPAQYGPDELNVSIDGTTKLSLAMSSSTSAVQNFNGSATLPLQIVPTLASMDGSPGGDGTFDLFGSGFQAGAMTVTIGGVTLTDSQFTNQYQNHIVGGANGQDRIVAPLTLDGPVTVTTAGGSASFPGYPFVVIPGVAFTGITATAGNGMPGGAGPSANVGQTIVLTGQGFTNSTLVQFSGEDASGTHGTLTRTGTASADGRSLSIVVPDLARTGNVTVLGSGTSFALQVVPVVRSVGGAVTSGNTIELETSGVTPGELTVTIDGQTATVLSLRDTVDLDTSGVGAPIAGQQLLTVSVPSGVSTGIITISTPGGSTSVVTGVAIAAQSPFSPSGDVGDTLATATAITLPVNASIAIPGTVGDGANGNRDVDLYQVSLGTGEQLNVVLNGNLYSQIRFFNAAGQQVGTQFGPYVSPNTITAAGQFVAPAAGTYYVGITGYNNISYDPTVAGSGSAASYTGAYTLTLERMTVGGTRISGITATASSGTPAIAGIASANIGDTITLNGSGLVSGDQVVFTGLDNGGNLYSITVAPSTVAADGSSLTVVVPAEATTGTVRLARDTTGVLLQIIPTLSLLDITTFPQLTGSGFAEGLTTLNFGAAALADTGRDSNGLDIFNTNHGLDFTLPNGVEGGPFSVTTPGGTSAVYGETFTGITGTATSGTPANGALASANAGQTITITGTGLTTSTDVVFRTIDDSGNKSQVVVHPTTAAADGTSATVVVPGNAITDVVRVIGDATTNDVPLQIVPVVSSLTVTSVNSDGSFAAINFHGSGFVDGHNGVYQFGGTTITDASSTNQGPDVFSSGTQVNLSVPLNPASYGPVTVTTAGGTSAPVTLTATLTVANATATSGTPANAAVPSANPSQTITLTGSGLSTSTGVIGYYTGSDGVVRYVLMSPATAAADGTSATLTIPSYFNGVTQIAVIGATNPITLQIVPTLTRAQVDNTDAIRVFGTGLQEGSALNSVTYNFAGGSVSDTSAGTGVDVYNTISGSDNNAAYLPAEPVHGFGNVTVTTAGGTSAPIALNEMELADGYLRDVAMDPANPGQAWIADNGNPAKLHLVNLATGTDISSITLTVGGGPSTDFGSTGFFGGMQIVPTIPSGQTALTLNGVAVPSGSILLFDGNTNPDRVIAVDPSTGLIISTLVLGKNYDMSSGIYDPFSGNIYIIDRTTNPNSIVAINPATGAEVLNSRFNLPVNAVESGLALDPSGDGTFWYGSDQSNNLYHLSATGTVLQIDDLTLQGIFNDEINGLSFDSTGKLLVASKFGMVYRVTV